MPSNSFNDFAVPLDPPMLLIYISDVKKGVLRSRGNAFFLSGILKFQEYLRLKNKNTKP